MTPVGEGCLRPVIAATAGRRTRRAGPAPRLATRLRLAAAICLSLGALSLLGPGVARADDSLLCAGYSQCAGPGLSTHGYPRFAGASWWAMYPGINCTNYAAYVESQVYGVPAPGLLLGDAYQWSGRASGAGIPVDQTPTIGSVAVWGAAAPGMGGYGHVAVVEAIGAGGTYIDVSQSGMGSADDGYSWERVYRDGSSWESWPSSFIHFTGSGSPATLPRAGSRVPGAELVSVG